MVFFSKLALGDLYVSHRIKDILLVIAFIATLAVPLTIVWSLRKRSMSKVGVTPDKIAPGKKLRLAGKVFAFVGALILFVPPIIVTALNLPPASWLNRKQSDLFVGYYYPKVTFIVMFFANCAVVLVSLLLMLSIKKLLTGKTWGELFRSGSPTTAAPQTTAAAPQAVRKVFITHCHMCECSIAPELQRTVRTCPDCGADLSRQRR